MARRTQRVRRWGPRQSRIARRCGSRQQNAAASLQRSFVCLDGRNPSVVHCPASRFSVQSFTRFADLRTAAAQATPWNRASREQSES
jgi:hypothetical protein